ncbi:uncharacterized protein [Atheta coriaria]|uniref:uncharacterized protein isoform X1 n=1 Tax=Dalotia coriaria TaxID=877792 RepID=UPI0031F3D9E3
MEHKVMDQEKDVDDAEAVTPHSNMVLESPKPMAFTIDFGGGKSVDMQRHKHLIERYKHRRGQSLSKIEDVPTVPTPAKEQRKPQSANLPRKAISVEVESHAEEKTDKSKNVRTVNYKLRDGLSLPLKNVNSDRMTQSCTLPCIESPDIELVDVPEVSTPELEALRPPSPLKGQTPDNDHFLVEENHWVGGGEFDFDKSDAVSDAGTYTLDADAYSEEQKARMSIDREFKIEAVSNIKKVHDYVHSLANMTNNQMLDVTLESHLEEVQSHAVNTCYMHNNKLSPIVSPTQNFSINSELTGGAAHVESSKTFNKIMFPSPKAKTGIGSEKVVDHGSVISVTSSGAFRSKADKMHARKLSLTKSEIHVEAYTDNTHTTTEIQRPMRNLSANLVLVSEKLPDKLDKQGRVNDEYLLTTNGDESLPLHVSKVLNLPPPIGGPMSGKMSPTKIPSPIHSVRPRSRNSSNSNSLNIDLSDSSMETESYLRPTEKLLNTLQQRLSLDSDPDSEGDGKYLNNDARSLLKKPTHLRHNSLDEKNLKISNKLEHFQNKKFIDQTNVLNQYTHNKVVQSPIQHKIQNSPNNSPIRRSSSFSTKNQINTKFSNVSNIPQKETNIRNSPGFARNGSIQRSASTAAIRPNLVRVPSSEHKIDRSQYGDTESSSEEDLLQNNLKKKDITATRYNRAFSLRRARLDHEVTPPPQMCPNTPEMRRKFQPSNERQERAISVDRKPVKAPDVQSRYLQNLTRTRSQTQAQMQSQALTNKAEAPVAAMKSSPKIGNTATKPAPKVQVFSRTDTGRFSMRTNKPPMTNSQKTIRRDVHLSNKKPSGPRSNSSLTSKEVEFQNWKRRKSYDPMKAAAEGKKKAEAAKRQNVNPMTQSYHEANQDGDSSPSHSSSVHRSQSFHGTAALEQYISSEDEDEDLTLSADEGFSPPTPSPCDMSPNRTNRTNLRYAWKDQLH